MNEEKLIEELISSQKLQDSLVAFLADLLKEYFSGEISEDAFKKEFDEKARQARICFSYMKKDIKVNQKAFFKNEFKLTDQIGDVVYYGNLSGQEFKDKLKEFVVNYNRTTRRGS